MLKKITLMLSVIVASFGVHKCTQAADLYVEPRQQQPNFIGGLIALPFTIAGTVVTTAIQIPIGVLSATGQALNPQPVVPEPRKRRR